MLSRLCERSAPAFAAFSNSLRDSRATASCRRAATAAAALWEAVVGEKVTRPDRFITQLFELNEGRARRICSTRSVSSMRRAARSRSACGCTNASARLERFKTLATSGISAFRDWHLRTQPFSRASYDLAMTLMRVTVDDNGVAASRRRRVDSGRACSAATICRTTRRGRCAASTRTRSTRRG